MITIVVASFGVLSPRCVIVPRQSKQVTSSTRQHQKLRFPSAMAASPNGKSDTSNTWLDVTEVLLICCLWFWTPHQSEKRQAIDCFVYPCCAFCTVSKPMGPTSLHLSRCEADHLLPHYVEAKNVGALPPCPFGLERFHVVVFMYTVNEIFTVPIKGQGVLDAFAILKKKNYCLRHIGPSVCPHETTPFFLEELEWSSTELLILISNTNCQCISVLFEIGQKQQTPYAKANSVDDRRLRWPLLQRVSLLHVS